MSDPKLFSRYFDCEDTRHLFVTATQEEADELARAAAEKLIAKGKGVRWEDGTREHVNVNEVYEKDGHGDMFPVFADDGERTLHERVRVRVDPAGAIHQTKLRRSWRRPRDW